MDSGKVGGNNLTSQGVREVGWLVSPSDRRETHSLRDTKYHNIMYVQRETQHSDNDILTIGLDSLRHEGKFWRRDLLNKSC